VKVVVQGLWHLGTVVAACLAAAGHEVVGLDGDGARTRDLAAGCPPVFEPGLEALVREGLSRGRLRFTSDPAEACAGAEALWVTYDTPVDDDDRADVAFVVAEVERVWPWLPPAALVVVSSQVPVGTTRNLERAYRAAYPAHEVSFVYSPENLRLGRAIEVFRNPDRVIVGIGDDAVRPRVHALLAPVTDRIEWMSVESAEMTKHALNAFLATSVAFINEVAAVAERVGADAMEVARGLKSERRIGPGAYLSPGGAFAGGTLARDVVFLTELGGRLGVPTGLVAAVRESNEAHKQWAARRLADVLGDLAGRRIAVWGLTYKPGTDTLRRSSAIELCRVLAQAGALVGAHDPMARVLPADLTSAVALASTAVAALEGAEALVVSTPWPDYRSVAADAVVAAMRAAVVLDASRFLDGTLGRDARIRYLSVGKAA